MEVIATIASVPAVIAIVNVLKQFGVAGRWATLAALLVGIALNVGNFYLGESGVYQAAVTGMLVGLGAAGVYDLVPSGE
jgi:hypothetical protein